MSSSTIPKNKWKLISSFFKQFRWKCKKKQPILEIHSDPVILQETLYVLKLQLVFPYNSKIIDLRNNF